MAERRLIRAADPAGEAGALLAGALARFDRARLAIPGGSAARALPEARRRLGARWGQVRLTWVDERCVAFDDRDSNRGEAHRAGLLDRAEPPAVELPLFDDGEAPEVACRRARTALEKVFGAALDVALLGMGEDGHIASLFPGHEVKGELVGVVEDSPKPPARRVSLTLPMLRTARASILLATGEGKRAALTRLLEGDAALPASALEGLVIVTDLDLGGGLS